MLQGVDHHVTDEVCFGGSHPLAGEVDHPGLLGDEEVVADGVGADPVDLLGHAHVAGAQSGLDVDDGVVALLGHESAGDRRVDVADDEHDVGVFLEQHRLEGHHDLRGGLGVRPAPDAEVVVWLGEAELGEEHVRHAGVVVLSGVDDARVDVAAARELTVEGGHLHEVGAGTDYGEDFRHIRVMQSAAFELSQITLRTKLRRPGR